MGSAISRGKRIIDTSEIADRMITDLLENKHDSIVANIPSSDMVGHPGVLKEAITACEIIDECIGRIVQTVRQVQGYLFITADHCNCEQMLDLETNSVNTEHSGNPVPLIIVGPEFEGKPLELPPGKLGDIAPTILKLMEVELPIEMSGRNLLE